jgi:hypothetical protein
MHSARRKSGTGGRATRGERGDTSGSPLTAHAASDLLQGIVRDGTVAWSLDALDRARVAGITTAECANAMLSGVADPAELRDGQWHYRLRSPRMWILLTFRSDDEAAVVDVGRTSG